ncbi:MAG: hypothetical protein MRJ66_05265 [Nitrospira sp.]|nr:hypothetical protein [Nitrospira sp.]MDR4463659.1 hypothetical protein [Nitrospira sp.]MDR4469026.1 hypothetical protein [Nitrospira sp.]
MSGDYDTSIRLPLECERALLEQFVKAEAMALRTVRSAQQQDVPANVYTFLRKHEEDEQQHLAQFRAMLDTQSPEQERLPSVPRQWPVLAVQIYGYESLGLEFARLLRTLRPDLASIFDDEVVHVAFFEREIRRLLDGTLAEQARQAAVAWRRKLPTTVNRYLAAAVFDPYRPSLVGNILAVIERRFTEVGLLRIQME